MGLRDDLYRDIDKLYMRKLLRVFSLRETSLQAISEGRLPEGLDDKTKDVIRWLLEDREMRLRRKRDLALLHSEWQVEKEERKSELNTLLEEFTTEREVTRANWKQVQSKVTKGRAMVDGRGYIGSKEGWGGKVEEQPAQGSEQDESKEKGWQIGEGV